MSHDSQPRASLSAGTSRRWGRSRPRLALDTPGEPTKKAAPVTLSVGRAVKTLLGVLLLVGAAAGAGWLILGMTVLPTVPVGTDTVLVQRASHPLGKTPVGETVLVTTLPTEGPLDRLALMFSSASDNAVVQIVATPAQHLTSSVDGTVLADGIPTAVRAPETFTDRRLDGEYLAACVTGGCGEPGEAVLVETDMVVGKVRGTVSLTGLGPVPGED